MKTLLAAILTAFASTAMATGGTVPAPKPVQPKIISVDKSTDIYQNANAWSDATAVAGAYGGYVGNVSNSMNVQAAEIPDKVKLNNVPDVTTIIASPTANCRNTFGGGVSVAGFGGSVGSSVLDEGCDTREDVRLLHNLGLVAESVQRMCAKPELNAALGVKCAEYNKNAPKPAKNVGQ